jgi:uncharacterized delta-60 repeat protein
MRFIKRNKRDLPRLFVGLAMGFIFISLLLPNFVRAAMDELDSTFGNGGKVVTKIGEFYSTITDLLIQPDGKIIAVGTDWRGDYALARYKTDGSLDSTFGSSGIVITPLNGTPNQGVLQNDGKIVVAGGASLSPGAPDIGVVRYNADGSLDQTFGSGGKVTTDFFNFTDIAYGVAIQSDSKIVVSGAAGQPGVGFLFAVVRYNADGSLDASFGNGGKVTHNFSDPRAYDVALESPAEIAVQNDGKIVVVGYTLSYFTFYDAIIVRYNSDGSLDNSFGDGGKVLTDFARHADYATSLVIQPDGKIVVGGYTAISTEHFDFGLIRYNPNGSLDNTFGQNGKVSTDFFGSYERAYSVALKKNGKIVLAGETYRPTSGYDFAVAQYNSDGSLDSTFGDGGKV